MNIVQLNDVSEDSFFVISNAIKFYRSSLKKLLENDIVSLESIMHFDIIEQIYYDLSKHISFRQTIKTSRYKAIVLSKALRHYQTNVSDVSFDNVLAIKIQKKIQAQIKINFI